MEGVENLKDIDLLMVMVLVLPGFISLKIFGFLFPAKDHTLKDVLLEVISFGILNFVLIGWILPTFAATLNPAAFYLLALVVFLVAPMFWPWLLIQVRQWLSDKGWILGVHRNSWDSLFSRRETLWVIVHMKDGLRIGGYYGPQSYATLFPNSGHLYLEQLWELNEEGHFVSEIPWSRGVVLRPEDYHFIEAFRTS